MIPLIDTSSVNKLLCIGAHPDDIELGVGGTVMRLIEQNPNLQIHWVVFAGVDPVRAEEARQSAAQFTQGAAEVCIEIHEFKDAYLPWQGEQVKQTFEILKNNFSPDLIFTHYGHDSHQDHRLVSELTWNTWRDHAILEYEILKWDGDLGNPNVFIPIEESVCQKKVEQIYNAYTTQQTRSWFKKENFQALMRIRGVECNADYAEAFYARKILW